MDKALPKSLLKPRLAGVGMKSKALQTSTILIGQNVALKPRYVHAMTQAGRAYKWLVD